MLSGEGYGTLCIGFGPVVGVDKLMVVGDGEVEGLYAAVGLRGFSAQLALSNSKSR